MDTGTWLAKFNRNSRVFLQYNRRRIDYLRNYLPQKKRDVFDLIPFILHEDDPHLPGNEESRGLACGISCFTYSSALKGLIKEYFPKFVPKRQAKTKLPVIFLAIMGSAGTVAFTEDSDMDFWVGIETEKNDPGFTYLFGDKLKSVEQWAAGVANVEIHFFIADLKKIRNDDYGEVNEESCGSALGKLLKDEFYRTAIFIEGKIPYYWIMPVGTNDATYKKNISVMHSIPEFARQNYVDLGNVHTVQKTEYFGASLWQILKGIRAPFKSVLKMALIDKYSSEGEFSSPLCESYKNKLFSIKSTDLLDPYIFMIEEIRSFYTDQKLESISKLIEECFLIRNLLTSRTVALEEKARVQYFLHTGKRWGWTKDQIKLLASFREWSYIQRENLNKRIMVFLLESYRRIRSRSQEADTYISDRDKTVLSKKILSFFGQQEGKVPFEFSLMRAKDISSIEIEEQKTADNLSVWNVKLRLKSTKSAMNQVVKNMYNPVVACAWCSINRFFRPNQQISIRGNTKLSPNEAVHLIRSINDFFPKSAIETLRIDDLLDDMYITHLFVLLNWNDPDWNFSIKSMFVFFRNTMGEVFFDNYLGKDYMKWLSEEIMTKKIGKKYLKNLKCEVHSPKEVISPTRRLCENLSRQIKKLILEIQ